MTPFGHRHHDDEPAPAQVSATAIVLEQILPAEITNYQQKPTAVLVEQADGTTALSGIRLDGMWYHGVITLGARIPVIFPAGDTSVGALDVEQERIPSRDEVVAVIGEALGGPTVAPAAPDEWRVAFALQYAEQVIAGGTLSATQADAIRTRIRAGI